MTVGSNRKIGKDSKTCIVRHIDCKSSKEVFPIVVEVIFIQDFFKLKSSPLTSFEFLTRL